MKLERTELEAQVIQSLREGPKTIKQLASATGNYERQVRTAVENLFTASLIYRAGYHDRSILYRINAAVADVDEYAGRLPYHDLKVSGLSANIVDLVGSALPKCQPLPPQGQITRSDTAMRSMYPLLAVYISQVLNMEPVTLTRSELLQCYKQINSAAFLLKQILEYEEYWTDLGIEQIRKAPLLQENVAMLIRQGEYANELLGRDDKMDEV